MVTVQRREEHFETDDAYFIDAHDGTLCGNGKDSTDGQGAFEEGDRIGMLLDLDRLAAVLSQREALRAWAWAWLHGGGGGG